MRATQSRATVGLVPQKGWSDQGDRYVVSYADGTGQRRDYGFTNDVDEARKWAKKIRLNPMWREPKIRDRQSKRGPHG